MSNSRHHPAGVLARQAGLLLAGLVLVLAGAAWWLAHASEQVGRAQRQADLEALLDATTQAVRESMATSAYGTIESRLLQALASRRLEAASVIDPSGKVLASVRRDAGTGQPRPSFTHVVLSPPPPQASVVLNVDAPVVWKPLGPQASLGWLRLEQGERADLAWLDLGRQGLLAVAAGGALLWLIFVWLLRRALSAEQGTELAMRPRHEPVVHQDSLTGLPDRDAMLAKLRESMRAVDEAGMGSLAICYIDIDRFRLINQECSPRVGDKVLQAVASRIRSIARQGDMLARVAGDEFVLLVHGLNNIWEVEPVLSRLLHVSTSPFLAEGHSARLTFSIGVAIYPQDRAEPVDFLAHAEQAMQQAKRTGGNGWAMGQATDEDESSTP